MQKFCKVGGRGGGGANLGYLGVQLQAASGEALEDNVKKICLVIIRGRD